MTHPFDVQPYRCQSCRWWRRDDPWGNHKWESFRVAGFGFCRCDHHHYLPTLPDYSGIRFNRTTVIHEADENWGMITGPDHGCVSWEEQTG